ncbi:MAG: hypothetical protein ABEJ76_05755 [Halanaeroarchaeum sp.]
MSELPEWIEDKLEFNTDRRLQQRHVAEVFFEEDERPFLTRRQVQSRLKGDYTRGPVIERLKELVEIGVLENDPQSGGDLYWLSNDKSEWPIPPDVTVEPVEDEMTVSEFFSLESIQVTLGGIGSILLGSWLVWIGGFMGAGNHSFFLITPANIIAGGFLAFLIGWLFVGYGAWKYINRD